MSPIKNGIQTSEFWVSTLAGIYMALVSSGIIPHTTEIVAIVNAVAALLIALGYTACRSFVKTTALNDAAVPLSPPVSLELADRRESAPLPAPYIDFLVFQKWIMGFKITIMASDVIAAAQKNTGYSFIQCYSAAEVMAAAIHGSKATMDKAIQAAEKDLGSDVLPVIEASIPMIIASIIGKQPLTAQQALATLGPLLEQDAQQAFTDAMNAIIPAKA